MEGYFETSTSAYQALNLWYCCPACAAAADAGKAFELYNEMKAAGVETERQVTWNSTSAHGFHLVWPIAGTRPALQVKTWHLELFTLPVSM